MADYNEPGIDSFNSAESSALDVLRQSAPAANTKAGSVIRELVIRPLAYLYAWLKENFDTYIVQFSAEKLLGSPLTVNPTADLVASNFFITRKEGVKAHGTVTLQLDRAAVQLSAGLVFDVNGVQLQSRYRVQSVSPGSPDAGLDQEDGIWRSPIYPYVDGTYIIDVPVEAVSDDYTELDAGVDVMPGFDMSGLVGAWLSSAVTGGMPVETDAEMMQRVKLATAESGIGSYYGIGKKLSGAPVDITGYSVVAGEHHGLLVSRYNSLNINPGGIIDCYVRTQTQPSRGRFTLSAAFASASGGRARYTATLDPEANDNMYIAYAGFYRVCELEAAAGDDSDWTVEYVDSENAELAGTGRFGVKQKAVITLECSLVAGTEPETIDITGQVEYAPGLKAVSDYMQGARNSYIGQRTVVKAAVPVSVNLSCSVRSSPDLTEDEVVDLKRVICQRVSAYGVGHTCINFSDLRERCAEALPRADLRLPCALIGSVVQMDGSIYSFGSNSGLLDISNPVSVGHVDPAACYFSLIPDNITLNQI